MTTQTQQTLKENLCLENFLLLKNLLSPKEKIKFLAYHAFDFQQREMGNATLFTKDKIDKWIEVFYRRFYSQQFKRSCLPDGVKIGSVGLSPRGDFLMPSDAVLE